MAPAPIFLPGLWHLAVIVGDDRWDGTATVTPEPSKDVTYQLRVEVDVSVLGNSDGRDRIIGFVRKLRGAVQAGVLAALLPTGPSATPRAIGGGGNSLTIDDTTLSICLGTMSPADVKEMLNTFHGRRKKDDPQQEIHAT